MVYWGGSFIAVKIAVRYLTPYELILARFIPSAVLLWMWILWKRIRNNSQTGLWSLLSRKQRIGLLAASFLVVPGYHFSFNTGLTIIPAGWSSLVISLNPACITVFAAILLKERIGLKRWLGITIAFLALLFIALTNDILNDDGGIMVWWRKLLGIVITLGAVLSWGGHSVIGKKLIRDFDPLIVLTWIISLGTIMVLPGFRYSFIEALTEAPIELWVSLIFLSVFCTVIAFAIWYWVLRIWDASRTGAFIYLVPLFALLSGRWILKEPLDLGIIAGASAVIGGVILAGGNAKKML